MSACSFRSDTGEDSKNPIHHQPAADMYGSDYSTLPTSPNSSVYAPHGDLYGLHHHDQQIQPPVAGAYARAVADNDLPSDTQPADHISEEGRKAIAASKLVLQNKVNSAAVYDPVSSNRIKMGDYLANIIEYNDKANNTILKEALGFLKGVEGFGDANRYHAMTIARNRFLHGMNSPGKMDMLSRCLSLHLRSELQSFISAIKNVYPDDFMNMDTMSSLFYAAKGYVEKGGDVKELRFNKDLQSSMAKIAEHFPNQEAVDAVNWTLTMPVGEKRKLAGGRSNTGLNPLDGETSRKIAGIPDPQMPGLLSGLKRKRTDQSDAPGPLKRVPKSVPSAAMHAGLPGSSRSLSASSYSAASHELSQGRGQGQDQGLGFATQHPSDDLSLVDDFTNTHFQDGGHPPCPSGPMWWMTTSTATNATASTTAPNQIERGHVAGFLDEPLSDQLSGSSDWAPTISANHWLQDSSYNPEIHTDFFDNFGWAPHVHVSSNASVAPLLQDNLFHAEPPGDTSAYEYPGDGRTLQVDGVARQSTQQSPTTPESPDSPLGLLLEILEADLKRQQEQSAVDDFHT